MQPDYVVIGGGNVEKLNELPEDCRRGDNTLAFKGGFRLWQDKALVV
jgi:polyphosphate glucokinase